MERWAVLRSRCWPSYLDQSHVEDPSEIVYRTAHHANLAYAKSCHFGLPRTQKISPLELTLSTVGFLFRH